jgi:hypothetical protein
MTPDSDSGRQRPYPARPRAIALGHAQRRAASYDKLWAPEAFREHGLLTFGAGLLPAQWRHSQRNTYPLNVDSRRRSNVSNAQIADIPDGFANGHIDQNGSSYWARPSGRFAREGTSAPLRVYTDRLDWPSIRPPSCRASRQPKERELRHLRRGLSWPSKHAHSRRSEGEGNSCSLRSSRSCSPRTASMS